MQPLVSLIDRGNDDVLTSILRKIYAGPLSFPQPREDRPYIFINFVHSLDGLVTFNISGRDSGGDISGNNQQDRFVMGLLRTLADGVMMGANAIRQNPSHLWTPGHISKEYASLYSSLRSDLGKSEFYQTFFVTGSGHVRGDGEKLPAVFTDEESEAWFVTTAEGCEVFRSEYPTYSDQCMIFGESGSVDLQSAMRFLRNQGIKWLLVEGGPTFVGSLMARGLWDEIFLTSSPQIIGNSPESGRLTFVENMLFVPENAQWLDLVSVKLDGEFGNTILRRYRRRQPH